jgi:glyoxylase-like metal-dependent hydrolase (beta-lactamase superfamily II)
MTDHSQAALSPSAWSGFKKLSISDGWFEVYQITDHLFVFHEPHHYEETVVNLIIGEQKAALIDTGCGIGDLRTLVEAVMEKPVIVINTHTHLDHLGSNRQFDEIAMFDHPLTRRIAEAGTPHEVLQTEILDDRLVSHPWPDGFDPSSFALPPIKVSRWLADGDRIEVGGRELEVIYTPGEAADHICLLDRADRLLFCGDILLEGSVWTHLEGGSLSDLVSSYQRLMHNLDDFDHLMPGHNGPWLDKELLPETLAGAEKVFAGQTDAEAIIDPWNRPLKKYAFGRLSILTRAD